MADTKPVPEPKGPNALSVEEMFADALSNDQTIPTRPPDQSLASLKLLSSMTEDKDQQGKGLYASLARAETVWLRVGAKWLLTDPDLRRRLGGYSWVNVQRAAAFLRREYDLWSLRSKAEQLFKGDPSLRLIAGPQKLKEMKGLIAKSAGGFVGFAEKQGSFDVSTGNSWLKALASSEGLEFDATGGLVAQTA